MWNADKAWESSPILKLQNGMNAAMEVQSACISNSSIGVHGIFASAAGSDINLRSSDRMSLAAGTGFVEGTISVPLA